MYLHQHWEGFIFFGGREPQPTGTRQQSKIADSTQSMYLVEHYS
jgi:hypothetical protein